MQSGRPVNHQGVHAEGEQAPGSPVDSPGTHDPSRQGDLTKQVIHGGPSRENGGPSREHGGPSQEHGGPSRDAGGGTDHGGRRFSFDIASDFTQARAVQDQIIGEVIARGFGENDLFALKLALEEAVINAIKHGNKLDPAKRVKIEATVSDDEVDITIQDQGPGFHRESVPDPTLEENLERNSGRGIMLIEAYMTTAEWTDQGRRLHMNKRREASMVPRAS
jgi:serine/threonine-protein kinase RsbW